MSAWRRASTLTLAVALARAVLAEGGVHVVEPGETLWTIAEALSGDPYRWPELYRANRDQIQDPSRLYPGQQLAIPDFSGPRPPAPQQAADPPATE